MGKIADLSPRKRGQIQVLLENSDLKQIEIAQRMNVSTSVVSRIKSKLVSGKDLGVKRAGKCGRKRLTTPRMDRKIVRLAQMDRRASCRRLAINLASEGHFLTRRTVNRRLCEAGLKSYRPRMKPRLTKKMIEARRAWAETHSSWTADDWSKVLSNLCSLSF